MSNPINFNTDHSYENQNISNSGLVQTDVNDMNYIDNLWMLLFVSCYTSQWPWIRSQPVKNSKASIVINSCMNYIDNLWMVLFVSCYPSQWPWIRSQQVIILNYHSPLLTNNIIIRETTFLLGPL